MMGQGKQVSHRKLLVSAPASLSHGAPGTGLWGCPSSHQDPLPPKPLLLSAFGVLVEPPPAPSSMGQGEKN